MGSIDKQQILLSSTTNATTATTAFFFASSVNPSVVKELPNLSYIVFNNYGQPQYYANYSGQLPWILTQNSAGGLWNNIPLTSLTNNYITGYSTTQNYTSVLSTNQQATIQTDFANNVIGAMTSSTTNIIPIPQTYVFFNTTVGNDMYVNIKMTRTTQTLDTLNIYNNPINSVPPQNATTGILFGKLEALQAILDADGNNIRVPLVNVPIGIFNPSDDFPLPTSVDSNGDRFYMNIQEAANQNQYFDQISYLQDIGFLKSDSQFTTDPAKFLYTTLTNENGEFVIYNAPVGSQTVVFEVDLFKQGLTKDEIILNYFPFPTNRQAAIGQLPCYYYNQIPVNILPAWGTFQTGYTQLDIATNLDLRKWTTYIFPPVTYGTTPLQQVIAQDPSKTAKIDVRDMTLPGFPIQDLNIDQIGNDLARRDGAKFLWYNEITQQTSEVQFYQFGCNVIKLPANLYDKNARRTDQDGIPTGATGVWLSAYQFKTYIDDAVAYRATGGYKGQTSGNTPAFSSHYDLNYTSGGFISPNQQSSVGTFPYEQPWSLTYPNQYSIPRKPTQQRFGYDDGRTFGGTLSTSLPGPYIVEEPAYSDGDLIGNVVTANGANAGGFGVQNFEGVWFPNRIALVATETYSYKYEAGVSWNETYANGFQPFWTQATQGIYASNAQNTPLLAGMSSVPNGEQFQRLECGYGYIMKYHGWPRIFRYFNSDVPFLQDVNGLNQSDPTNPGPAITYPGVYGSYQTNEKWSNTIYNLNNENFALAMNQSFEDINNPNIDGIDIYRIVESGISDIAQPSAFVIPSYIALRCGQDLNKPNVSERCYQFILKNEGNIIVGIPRSNFNNNSLHPITIYYTIPTTPFISGATNNNDTIYLAPGQSIILGGNSPATQYTATYITNIPFPNTISYVAASDLLENVQIILPGNTNYNPITHTYSNAAYSITISPTTPTVQNLWSILFNPQTTFLNNIGHTAGGNTPYIWYIRTSDGSNVSDGINTLYSFKNNPNATIQAIFVQNVLAGGVSHGNIGYNGPTIGLPDYYYNGLNNGL